MNNSKYTIQLSQIIAYQGREEVESWFTDYELSDYLSADQIKVIEYRGVWTKQKLARKIVDHYLFHEIGSETMGLFKQRVGAYMREIMERYLPEIYSSSIEYDPMINIDLKETYEHIHSSTYQNESSSQARSDSSGTGNGLTINSDTPQGQINKQDVLAGKYATSTSGSETFSNANNASSGQAHSGTSGSDTTNYTKQTRGNSGVMVTNQKLIQQYRDIIISTDNDIIDRLGILFMGIF